MRWKLLLIASLLATLIGAGTSLLVIFYLFNSSHSLRTSDLYVICTLLFPLLAIILASFFVYRHTARRRPLQAILTALIAIFLILTVFIISSILYARPTLGPTMPAPLRPSVG